MLRGRDCIGFCKVRSSSTNKRFFSRFCSAQRNSTLSCADASIIRRVRQNTETWRHLRIGRITSTTAGSVMAKVDRFLTRTNTTIDTFCISHVPAEDLADSDAADPDSESQNQPTLIWNEGMIQEIFDTDDEVIEEVRCAIFPKLSTVQTAQMESGREREKSASKVLNAAVGKEFEPGSFYVSVGYSYIGGSPDAVYQENGRIMEVAEFKEISRAEFLEFSMKKKALPLKFSHQCQHHMFVTATSTCKLVLANREDFSSRGYLIVNIERDQSWQESFIAKASFAYKLVKHMPEYKQPILPYGHSWTTRTQDLQESQPERYGRRTAHAKCKSSITLTFLDSDKLAEHARVMSEEGLSTRVQKQIKALVKARLSKGWMVSSMNPHHSGHAQGIRQARLQRTEIDVEEIRQDVHCHGMGLRNVQSRLRAKEIDVTSQQLRNLIDKGRQSGEGGALLQELGRDPSIAFLCRLSRISSGRCNVQCSGKTLKGTRCSRAGLTSSSADKYYCQTHSFQNVDSHGSGDGSADSSEDASHVNGRENISGRVYALKFFGNDHVYKVKQCQLQTFLNVQENGVRQSAFDQHLMSLRGHRSEYKETADWDTFDVAHERDLFLDAVLYCFSSSMKRIARSPEIIVFDYTFKTNNRDYVVCVPCTADGHNKNASWGLGLLSGESGDMTSFVFLFALPFLYGNVLDRVRLISTDNGSAIVPVVEAAIKCNLYGVAIHRLCYWHAVILKFNDGYPRKFQESDNSTGRNILQWFHHIVWNVETVEEVQSHLVRMAHYLQQQQDMGLINDTIFDCLQEFIGDVTTLIPKLSLAYTCDPNMTLCCRTSGRGESEHRALKKTSGHMLNGNTSTLSVIRAEKFRIATRNSEAEHRNMYLAKSKPSTYIKNGNTTDDWLTPFAVKLLRERVSRISEYSVCAVPEGDTRIGTLWKGAYKIRNIIHVHCSDSKAHEIRPPWYSPPRIRTVLIIECEGTLRMHCSGFLCREHGIPCVHALAINKGDFGFTDFHPRWFVLTNLGQFDACETIVPRSGIGHYYIGPELRVDMSAIFVPMTSASQQDIGDVSGTEPCSELVDEGPPHEHEELLQSTIPVHDYGAHFYSSGLSTCKEVLAQADRLPGARDLFWRSMDKLKADLQKLETSSLATTAGVALKGLRHRSQGGRILQAHERHRSKHKKNVKEQQGRHDPSTGAAKRLRTSLVTPEKN
eukprot:m.225471 g.225471  ORF g.225471 m.225471 type:complete len:1204 (+) comp19206_c0_seq9:332-3943(+)